MTRFSFKTFCVLLSLVLIFSSCATTKKSSVNKSQVVTSSTKSSSKKKSSSSKTSTSKKTSEISASYKEAYSYRTNKVHPLADKILKDKSMNKLSASDPDSYIKKVSARVTKEVKNDFERIKVFHDIVSLLLSYDTEAFLSGRIPPQDPSTVLKKKIAVCQGYADLFKAFCDQVNIPCETIGGYARGLSTSITDSENPSDANHAWNVVRAKENWYLVDCTWDSGRMEGKSNKKLYSTDWLFTRPDHFIYTHYPLNQRMQLMKTPVSAEKFSSLPRLNPLFFETILASNKISKITTVEKTFEFGFVPKKGMNVAFTLESSDGQTCENCVFITNDQKGKKALFSFPRAGNYVVSIFAFKGNATVGEMCGQFVVNAQQSSGVRFPTNYATSSKNAFVIEPLGSPLQGGTSHTFTVHVADKKNVAVIFGKEFVQLKNDGKGNFSGTVKIPNNVSIVKIGIADSLQGNYETLVSYNVK